MTRDFTNTLNDQAYLIHATPGPYFYYRDKEGLDDLWVIYAPQADQQIASITFRDVRACRQSAQHAVNARLLASAPSLRDALLRLLNAVQALPEDAFTAELIAAEDQAARTMQRLDTLRPADGPCRFG